MSTAADIDTEIPPTKPEPPSEAIKGMASKFMELRGKEGEAPNPAPEKKDGVEPVLQPKSAVDKLLSPPQKKEDAPATGADPLEQFKDDKTAAANIPKMRALIGQNLEEIKKLKAEVEEARKSVAPAKEQEELRVRLEALQKERDDLAEAVKIGNPEKSDDYRQIVQKRDGLIEKMTNRMTDLGGDGDKLKDALALTGKAKVTALKEAMSDLDVDDRTVLRLMVEDLEKVDEERKNFLANADKTWTAKQQERTEKERQTQEVKARELATELQALRKTLPDEFFMLRDAEESPEWNETNAKAWQEAEAMAKGQRPRADVLKTLAMGLRATHLAELFKAERDARIKAEEKLAGRVSAGPGIRGGTPPKPSTGERQSPGARFAGMLASGQIHGD